MADFRIDTGFLDHVKTKKLERLLHADGVLCLVRLWAYATESRPKGVLQNMDADDIEIAAGWDGEQGLFVDALKRVRFLDDESGVYSLHNWEIRNPWAYGSEDRSERARNAANKRWESGKDAERMQDACGQHADGNAPILSLPNPTSPNQKQPARVKNRALSVPEDFKPDANLTAWAEKEGIDNPEMYSGEFVDYWKGKGDKKSDWNATFRNHLRDRKTKGWHGGLIHQKTENIQHMTAADMSRVHINDIPRTL